MKTRFLLSTLCLSLLTLSACEKEESPDLTTSLEVIAKNVSLYNEPDLKMDGGVYLNEDDTAPLRNFIDVEVPPYQPVTLGSFELLPGNYYFKYRLEIPNEWQGPTRSRPFQVLPDQANQFRIDI